jgi:hypothetical protein
VPFWAATGSGTPNSSTKNRAKITWGITVVCPPFAKIYAISAHQSMQMSGVVLAFSILTARRERR